MLGEFCYKKKRWRGQIHKERENEEQESVSTRRHLLVVLGYTILFTQVNIVFVS